MNDSTSIEDDLAGAAGLDVGAPFGSFDPATIRTTMWAPGKPHGSVGYVHAHPSRAIEGWSSLVSTLESVAPVPRKDAAPGYVSGTFRTDTYGHAFRSIADTLEISSLRLDIDRGALDDATLADFLDRLGVAAYAQGRGAKYHVHFPLARPFMIDGDAARSRAYRAKAGAFRRWFADWIGADFGPDLDKAIDRALDGAAQVLFAYAEVTGDEARPAPRVVFSRSSGWALDIDAWTPRGFDPERATACKRRTDLGALAVPEIAAERQGKARALFLAAGASFVAPAGHYERWTCPSFAAHSDPDPREDCALVYSDGSFRCVHSHDLTAELRDSPDPRVAIAFADYEGSTGAVRAIGDFLDRPVPGATMTATAAQDEIRARLAAWDRTGACAVVVPPGVGKTRAAAQWLIDALRESRGAALLAIPTHLAADDLAQSLADVTDVRIMRVHGSSFGCGDQRPALAKSLRVLGTSPRAAGFCGGCSHFTSDCRTGFRSLAAWDRAEGEPVLWIGPHGLTSKAIEAGASIIVWDENGSPVERVNLDAGDLAAFDRALAPGGLFDRACSVRTDGGKRFAARVRAVRCGNGAREAAPLASVRAAFLADRAAANLAMLDDGLTDLPEIRALVAANRLALAGLEVVTGEHLIPNPHLTRAASSGVGIVFLSATPDRGVLSLLGAPEPLTIEVSDAITTSRRWHYTTAASPRTFTSNRAEWLSAARRLVHPLARAGSTLIAVDGIAQRDAMIEILGAFPTRDVVYQGITEGRNDWASYERFVSFGDQIPNWRAVRDEGRVLGLSDPDEYAAERGRGNLAQFHGRARSVSPWGDGARRSEVEAMHFGRMAPGAWHRENATWAAPRGAGRPAGERSGIEGLADLIERITIRAAARRVGADERTVRRWIAAGSIPAARAAAVAAALGGAAAMPSESCARARWD